MSQLGKYDGAIRLATVAAAGIGVPGAFSFGLDVTAVATTWVAMTIRIADLSGHAVDRAFATKLAAAAASGIAGYVGGSKLLNMVLHAIPGAGTLAAIGFNAALNGIYTFKLGRAMAALFDKGTFDTSDYLDASKQLLGVVMVLPTPHEVGQLLQLVADSRTLADARDFAVWATSFSSSDGASAA